MKYVAINTLVFTAFVFTAFVSTTQINAQTQPATGPQARGQATQRTPAVQANASLKKLGFRLSEWKTIHAHSDQEAKEAIGTLTKMGCEVLSDNHGNHIDVKYRCPEWKSLMLTTDQLINQWSTWCTAKGMETVVMNPSVATQNPTIQFRLATTRTAHLHDPLQAKQIVNTLELIGCQVTTDNHGNHMDATFSCPEWVTIELPSEDNAHAWKKWLDDSGFETKHEH